MTIRYLTAGESHGKALIGIIEGVPSGLKVSAEYINAQMKRRKLGVGRGERQKIEKDEVEILSGIRHGRTLGSPIALMIRNKDYKNWKDVMQTEPVGFTCDRCRVEVPRPGHADLVGGIKYNHKDMRNVLERASARETAMRVAIGSIARRFLEELGVCIGSRVVRIGKIVDASPLECRVSELNHLADNSKVRTLFQELEMAKEINEAKAAGDTVGGEFEVYAEGVPIGLGSYVHWDRRIEGEIGKAFLSLNGIKGVEIGLGFKASALKGSEVHDEYAFSSSSDSVNALTNRAGGIVGGMTTGQIIVVRAGMKPISTLMKPMNSVNLKTKKAQKAHIERSDICAVPAAAVIGESLLALILADATIQKYGGDSLQEIKQHARK